MHSRLHLLPPLLQLRPA